MPEIDARLDTGELAVKLVLQTERSHGTVLDIEFAPHVTVNGSPDGFREFARDLLDLVDMVSPPAGDVFDDIPPDPRVAPERVAAMADDPRSCVTRVTVIPNRWAPGPGDAA
jgi:hypothetical protein